jgi:hypothetical protein
VTYCDRKQLFIFPQYSSDNKSDSKYQKKLTAKALM